MMKQFGLKRFVIAMSILLFGVTSLPAEADEPGPFERLFHAMRRAMNEPQHRSAPRRSHKQTDETTNTPSERSDIRSDTQTATGSVSKPPSERNTRSATRAGSKKGDDLRYGIPVPGKTGFVTSPFSPDAGYIDVRGFAPGTPVKDPYTGKVFLTP